MILKTPNSAMNDLLSIIILVSLPTMVFSEVGPESKNQWMQVITLICGIMQTSLRFI